MSAAPAPCVVIESTKDLEWYRNSSSVTRQGLFDFYQRRICAEPGRRLFRQICCFTNRQLSRPPGCESGRRQGADDYGHGIRRRCLCGHRCGI